MMMDINRKELSRLSPEERLKRLKLMGEDRKKEVNEIEQLIKESMHELKIGKIAEEVAPEQIPVDISRLFGANYTGLERAARKEGNMPAKGTPGYHALTQTYEAYSQLKKLDKNLSLYGNLSEEEKSLVGQIGERISRAEKYMPQGEKALSLLDASRAVLYKLKKESGID